MKKKFTLITALTMSSMILMIALVGCNTSCNTQPSAITSEESFETAIIDGSAIAIIETEINGSKATETSFINKDTGTSSSSQTGDTVTSESTKGTENSNSNDSTDTQSTTTQTTTVQNNSNATNTPKPTNTPVPTTNQKNTPTPTKAPTNKPEPTATPVPTATPEPTATPTPEPTEVPKETTPSTGYAIIKVKVTSTVFIDDESTETEKKVDYFEVEGWTSNYHSNTASDYSYNGKDVGNKVNAKYGDNLGGYSAKAVEVVRFTN